MSKKDPWVKWFPGDFLHGVSELEAPEGWVYVIVLNQIYDKEGPIPYDAARLARRCRLRKDVVERAVETLIEYEKLTLEDGQLFNPRAARAIDQRQIESRSLAEAGRKGGQKSSGKPNENNDRDQAIEKPTESPAQAVQKLEAISQKDTPPPPEAGGDDFLFGGLKPERPKRAPRPAKAPSVKVEVCEEAISLWNALAKRNDLVSVRWPINDTRLAKLKKRLEDGGIARWKEALDKVERSRFLSGEGQPRNIGDAPWQAGLDFVLQPSSWDKIHEGTYRQDRTPPQVASDPSSWPSERWDRIHTRYRSTGAWPDGAGPKPEEPGYLGPKYYP